MYDLKLTCLWLLPSLGALALSSPEAQLQSLHSNNLAFTPVSLRSTPELQKRCTGDCVTCFGQGYQECSSDSTVCYKPGDPVHGEESCSGTSYNVPSVPTFDFCNDGSCATCFGEGFQNCPDSTVSCYKPGDSTYGLESACSSSSDTSSGSVSSSLPSSAAATGSSSQPTSSPSSSDGYNITSTDFCNNGGFDCKRCFGSTYIPCPESSAYASQSYCYDPNNSTSICPDGTQPAAGSGSGSTGSGSPGSGSSSSGGSDSASSSSSVSYTASAPSETSDAATQVTSSDAASETTSAGGGSNSGAGVAGGSSSDEDTSSTSSTTFTSSRTSSATSGSQTSSSDTNGEPISASSSGQSSVREGVFGVLLASVVCLGASAWFAL